MNDFLDALASTGRTFVTSVPDKGLLGILDALGRDDRFMHTACTREEEAIGLCAGAAFGDRRGVLLTQNSGIGNAINALTSLVSFYDLPLLMLVSMRGGPDERIAAQMPMGRATRDLLAACGIRIREPSSKAELIATLGQDLDGRVAVLATPEDWTRIASG